MKIIGLQRSIGCLSLGHLVVELEDDIQALFVLLYSHLLVDELNVQDFNLAVVFTELCDLLQLVPYLFCQFAWITIHL